MAAGGCGSDDGCDDCSGGCSGGSCDGWAAGDALEMAENITVINSVMSDIIGIMPGTEGEDWCFRLDMLFSGFRGSLPV